MINILALSLGLFLIIHGRMSHLPEVDATFKPHIESFIEELEERAIDTSDIGTVSVTEVKLNTKYFGMYYPHRHEIEINSVYWDTLTSPQQEQLLFHELGHSMGLQHTEGDGIMRPIGLLPDEYYTIAREELLDDMLAELKLPFQPKEANLTKTELMNNTHVVARFTASWCPPCKALAPVFDEVAAAHPEVKTYVIDVDQNPDLARDMNVRGIPCLIKVKDNKVDTVLVGNQPKPEIEKLFK